MGELEVFVGNRLETLKDRLARTLRDAHLDPLLRETVIVQSQGMRRWLTLELAKDLGCAASLDMPLPTAFMLRLAKLAAGEDSAEENDLFSREILQWRILALFENGLKDEVFKPVLGYLDSADQMMRNQLASLIADVFDGYQVYRPEMLAAWEKGASNATGLEHEAWQAALWRLLYAGAPSSASRANRFLDLAKQLEEAAELPAGFPARLAVFGVSSLPPFFFRVLRGLARISQVEVYALSPVKPDEKERGGKAGGYSSRLKSHPLLESLAKQTYELFDSLLNEEAIPPAQVEFLGFVDPGDSTCLRRIQSDLFNAGQNRVNKPPRLPAIDEKDASLTVHVCYSPRREVEVLRDQLLSAFDGDPDLHPDEVLVMVPDVETYAPFVEAVFSTKGEGTPSIPFRITDRPYGRENLQAEAFLRLFSLSDGRRTAAELLDFLDIPAIRLAAGMAEDETLVVREWVREANIRWGEDGRFREEKLQMPAFEENSWRAGFDRLLMGYATGPCDNTLIAGTLPIGEGTASRAGTLGKLVAWAEGLFKDLDSLKSARKASEWARHLEKLLRSNCKAEDDEDWEDLAGVSDRIFEFGRIADRAGYTGLIEPAVVRRHFENDLRDDSRGSGFLSGMVTVCALKPLRALPFKVIAVAGLDEKSFPRKDRPPAFDLRAARPESGDRSLRGDDRQLFLETLLAARERLILSYVGASQKDNKKLAPSVVLSELKDYIDERFESSDARPASDFLVSEHPLQPFSPSYFDGLDRFDDQVRRKRPVFSYSAEDCAAADKARTWGGALPAFVTDNLKPPEESEVISLNDLVECWVNPCKVFCRKRLGLYLEEKDEAIPENEAVYLDYLNKYIIESKVIKLRAKGKRSTSDLAPVLAAQGDLPPGKLGACYHGRISMEVEMLLLQIGDVKIEDPVSVEIKGDGWVVKGEVDWIAGGERLQFRPAKSVKPKDLIRAWIVHLALCLWSLEDPSRKKIKTRVFSRADTYYFHPIEDVAMARERFNDLVSGYLDNLAKPLPVFEHSSGAFAEVNAQGKSDKSAWKAARNDWFSDKANNNYKDDSDKYIALCFRHFNPVLSESSEFSKQALRLWLPIIKHRKEGEDKNKNKDTDKEAEEANVKEKVKKLKKGETKKPRKDGNNK